MDISELRTMLQFAAKNNMMHKPFTLVYEWYKKANSLV